MLVRSRRGSRRSFGSSRNPHNGEDSVTGQRFSLFGWLALFCYTSYTSSSVRFTGFYTKDWKEGGKGGGIDHVSRKIKQPFHNSRKI